MIVTIKLTNPYIEKIHRVNASPDDVLSKGGQQQNDGYVGPFIDIDTKEKFTINLALWAEVSVF